MTSPINLLDPLPRISNFRRSDNVKFVSVLLPMYVKRICLLFDARVYVCVCVCRNCATSTTLQVCKWRVKHTQRYNLFYFEFM